MAVGFLTSSTLISTIKREALVPTNQNTFKDADFLAMANQELRISMMPFVIQMHEEYFVRDSDPVAILANQNRYAIPYRAVGSKFRNVFYQDINGNLCSMTRIMPEDRPYYQQSAVQNRFIYFYMEGNEIALVPDVTSNPVGSLIFSFYMRPNELVDESRVSTIQSITLNGTPGITEFSTFGDTTINSNVVNNLATTSYLAVNQLVTGLGLPVNTIITGISGSSIHLNNNVNVTAVQESLIFYSTTSLQVDQIPQNVTPFVQNGLLVNGFTASSALDVLQTRPGHKILDFDKYPVIVDTTNTIITFLTTDLDNALMLGDYIAFAGECIIPNIPSDLHDLLAQRVVTRVLQALGDTQGLQNATQKLGDMQQNGMTLIDNRSEGQPMKINNINGSLRSAKLRKRGWL